MNDISGRIADPSAPESPKLRQQLTSVLRASTLGLARGQVLAAAALALGTAGAAYRLKAALPPIRIALLLAAAVLVFTLGEG